MTLKSAKKKQDFHEKSFLKKVPYKSTAKEVSFEQSTNSKIRPKLHVSSINSGSERVNLATKMFLLCAGNVTLKRPVVENLE